jgi:hypothetical protein
LQIAASLKPADASMMGRSASEQLKVPQSIPALRRFNPPGFPQN